MLNRVLLYAIMAVVGSGLVIGGYFAWKKTVEKAYAAQVMIERLEQALDDVKRTHEELKKVTAIANGIRMELQIVKDELREREQDIEAVIIGPAEDRVSSEVLKETVRRLRSQ